MIFPYIPPSSSTLRSKTLYSPHPLSPVALSYPPHSRCLSVFFAPYLDVTNVSTTVPFIGSLTSLLDLPFLVLISRFRSPPVQSPTSSLSFSLIFFFSTSHCRPRLLFVAGQSTGLSGRGQTGTKKAEVSSGQNWLSDSGVEVGIFPTGFKANASRSYPVDLFPLDSNPTPSATNHGPRVGPCSLFYYFASRACSASPLLPPALN